MAVSYLLNCSVPENIWCSALRKVANNADVVVGAAAGGGAASDDGAS